VCAGCFLLLSAVSLDKVVVQEGAPPTQRFIQTSRNRKDVLLLRHHATALTSGAQARRGKRLSAEPAFALVRRPPHAKRRCTRRYCNVRPTARRGALVRRPRRKPQGGFCTWRHALPPTCCQPPPPDSDHSHAIPSTHQPTALSRHSAHQPPPSAERGWRSLDRKGATSRPSGGRHACGVTHGCMSTTPHALLGRSPLHVT